MRYVLLFFAVAFSSCEKDDPICGVLVGHITTSQPPNYSYSYVIRTDEGDLYEVPSDSTRPYSVNDLGRIICID